MQIRTYKTQRYFKCPIFVRHYLGTNTWEYLTVIHGQIYTAHIEVKKKFLQRLFKLGYSRKEEEGAVSYLTAMAKTTVETVLGKNKKQVKAIIPTIAKTPPNPADK